MFKTFLTAIIIFCFEQGHASVAALAQENFHRNSHKTTSTDTPESVAVPIKEVNFDRVTQSYNPDVLLKAFQRVRDLRFLKDPQVQGFLRRITWLYPNDGCYSRAGLFSIVLDKMGYLRPAKVFIFGRLTLVSPNSPTVIRWQNHVAPAVRVGQEIYMLDPAINPRQPMPLKDWLSALGVFKQPPEATRIAICSTFTYHARQSSCSNGDPDEELKTSLKNSTLYWLPSERAQIKALGRDPDRELGHYPPWLSGRAFSQK